MFFIITYRVKNLISLSQWNGKMEKLEHLALMLNRRTYGKKYENFVVNALYTKIANPDLVPVTQQYVKNKRYSKSNPRKYYLLDLYFPQLNYGIEVDENHHAKEENILLDKARAEDILASIQCEEGRIVVCNKDDTPKTIDEVNKQINAEVKKIKAMIAAHEKETGKRLYWQDDEDRKNIAISKGVFDVNDDVSYEGITEIYNIVGHNIGNLGRCFVKLNSLYKLWGPYLAYQLDNGTLKTKNGWVNTLSEDRSTIYETVGDMKKCDTRNVPDGPWNENCMKRVVFMHIRDSFGKDRVKFLGVFVASCIETLENGMQKRTYKRISDKVKIADLKP